MEDERKARQRWRRNLINVCFFHIFSFIPLKSQAPFVLDYVKKTEKWKTKKTGQILNALSVKPNRTHKLLLLQRYNCKISGDTNYDDVQMQSKAR